MDKPSSMPFRHMTSQGWQNLAAAAMAVLYAGQIALDVAWHNMFGNLGIDFGSFWSAGYIANHYGYARVYDLQLMQQVQKPLVPLTNNPAFVFHAIPTPYLAIFIAPFQLLALLPPIAALWLWMLLNLSVLLWYLNFFLKRTEATGRGRLVLLVLISVPVFTTLFIGQVNVWLMICAGEFLRAMTSSKRFRAGLWLGGLLLKPQTLIILVPVLLLQRSWRTIAGAALSGALLMGVSVVLAGMTGTLQLIRLWLGYAGGLPTNDVQLMMNWRMVGNLIAPPTGTVIGIGGAVISFLAALYLWTKPLHPGSAQYRVAMAGTLAATGAVAWHSHVHMAMIMVPILLLLLAREPWVLGNRWIAWVFIPAALYFVRLLLASAMRAGALPPEINNFLDLLAGAGLFGLNLYILGWAVQYTKKPLIRAEQLTDTMS